MFSRKRPTGQVGKAEERPISSIVRPVSEDIRRDEKKVQEDSTSSPRKEELRRVSRQVDARHPLMRMVQPDRPNIREVIEFVRVRDSESSEPRERRGVANITKRILNGLALPLMRKWIAGESLEEAVVVAKGLNEKGSGVMINCLGEHYKEKELVEATKIEYGKMLDPELSSKADYVISFKLSQFGLDIDLEYCYENARLIAEKAKREGKRAWIDMERSSYTDNTLAIYERLIMEGYEDVGLCLQANLRRTANDLERLLTLNEEDKFVKIRLCKGAYKELPGVAYQTKEEVDENFKRLILRLADSNEENVLGIATHDPVFMELAKDISKKRKNVEVQMLKGIEENARMELIRDGVTVITYLPYGEDALSYCIRRVRKGRGTFAMIFKSMFRG